jgi:hypothetical protein
VKLGVQSSSLSSLPSVGIFNRRQQRQRRLPVLAIRYSVIPIIRVIRAIRGLKLARFPPRSALPCALLPSMSLHPVAPFSSQTGLTIETRSLPEFARRYPCGFTFYLGNPFPRFNGLTAAKPSCYGFHPVTTTTGRFSNGLTQFVEGSITAAARRE